MRIDVIVNTRARRYRAGPALIGRMAAACAGGAELHPTSSVAELAAVCDRIARRGTDLVAISGGDGSFMAGVTALARAFGERSLPPLALLPGGTVATVARNWGTSGDPAALLARIVRDHRDLRSGAAVRGAVRRPTLRARATTRSGVEERIGFIFGTGLVASFFDVYYERGGDGYSAAARIVARVFVESFYGGACARRVLDPLPCTIEVEGRQLAPRAWSLICSSVVRDLGIHMQVTYRAGEDLDRPHLVASALPPRGLGPRAPLVLAGRRIGGKDHFDDLVRDFTVRFGASTGAASLDEGPYILDGDPLRASEIRISAGPSIDVLSLRR
ncbi:diacylglycerol/lipid kinase family protein [Sorangium sp. So ce1151]|uniref:diacylglycerol/lipid kinase family protein n=1 Tax=Sorangium sp. So ce1151 TaxID=3133332 RepID=UPI003F5F9DE0